MSGLIKHRHVELGSSSVRCVSKGPSLKSHLRQLREIIPPDNPIVYFDYPVHDNVGDLLIHYATDRFFYDYGYHVARSFSWRPRGRRAQKIPPDATLVFHGGGNFGDLYPAHEKLRLTILERFRGHKAVVMPQSVYYESERSRDSSLAAYAQHPDLTICVRDDISQQVLSACPEIKHRLMPDMTHQLEDVLPSLADAGSDALYFLREDKERTGTSGHLLPEMRAGATTWDWARLMYVSDERWIERYNALHKYLYLVSLDVLAFEGWARYRAEVICRALRLFQSASHVYTDRLHGGLFSMLSGVPVTLVDNANGKIGNYYRTWLDGTSGVDIRD